MAPFRSSRGKNVGKLLTIFQTSSLGDSIGPPPPLQGSGGNFTYSLNGYTYHVFTSSGDFTVTGDSEGVVESLVIGGGGGAGGGNSTDYGRSGGGGGAGGFRCSFTDMTPGGPSAGDEDGITIGAGIYPVTVGNGGLGGPNNGGQPGQDSSWGPPSTPQRIIAKGGGRGSGAKNQAGQPGGSGGGASAQEQDNSPPTSFPGSPNLGGNAVAGGGFNSIVAGYPGGRNSSESNTGGGGGGAGSAGEDGSDANSSWDGRSGVGKAIPTNMIPADFGTTGPSAGRWFAQGGYASSENSGGAYELSGGGGANPDHWTSTPPNGINGAQNTGSGGGGRGDSQSGGNGGSGIVILRYVS